MEKSNIILAGNTGSGKILLVRTLAKILDVPCYIQDCTKLTASGYVGSDVEDCLVGLLRECNYDMRKAEMGIVVLDEGDKMAAKNAGMSITRDVSGECVQQSLLKIVEGDIVGVPPQGGRKHPEQQCLMVNTKNILFILSGAFVGIESIIKHRIGTCNTIGFDRTEDSRKNINPLNYLSPQDFRKFGMIPEFVGRFPIISHVNPLTKNDLVRILTEPQNAIVRQYQTLLSMDKINLTFTPDALELIASQAVANRTGARGLRAILDRVMEDIMFEIPQTTARSKQKTVTIDADYVRQRTLKMAG